MEIIEKVKLFLKEKGKIHLLDNSIHICLGGSHISKTNDETSDFDVRAVIVLNEDFQIGLESFDHEKIVSGENNINQYMDIDIEFFHYNHFINRLFSGQLIPTEMIHVNDDYILYKNDLFKPVLENNEIFLSKKIVYNYFGCIKLYTNKAFAPMQNLKRADKINRYKQYGYETKDAMKSIQYTQLMIEFLKTKTLNLSRNNYLELLEIKNGKYSLPEIKLIIEDLDKEKEALLKISTLADEPNFTLVNNFKKDYIKYVYKNIGITI